MRPRRLAAATLAAATLIMLATGPAAAHVTVNPGEAAKGARAELTFRVPNERDHASTTKLEVTFPTDHPIPSARILPAPGWTATLDMAKLAQPVTTDDGQITEAVGKITWSGGTIGPDQYMNFTISAGPLPADADQLIFKAVQTYSNGETVRWIEEAADGAAEPEHAAPVLKLTAAAAGAATQPAGAPPAAAVDVPTVAQVDSAMRVGILGTAVGVTGLLVGAVALVTAARRRGASTTSRP